MIDAPLTDAVNELSAGTQRIVADALGQDVQIGKMRRLTGGTSHDSWAFDAVTGGGETRPLLLRRDFSAEVLDLDLATEFDLLTRLHGAGIAVPRPLVAGDARSPIGAAFIISERLTGGDVRKQMARQECDPATLGETLVALQAQVHALDWEPLLGALLPHRGGDTVRDQIDHWADIAVRNTRGADPLLSVAIGWLYANRPAAGPLCLIHGDYKANNIVAGEDGRLAIIDWELAHIGDPLEDIAWTLLWRTPHDLAGGMLSPEGYVSAYEAASGTKVNRERLDYWRIFALMKLLAVFRKSVRLHGASSYPRPTHVMLERAIPWLHRQLADRLKAAVARERAA